MHIKTAYMLLVQHILVEEDTGCLCQRSMLLAGYVSGQLGSRLHKAANSRSSAPLSTKSLTELCIGNGQA